MNDNIRVLTQIEKAIVEVDNGRLKTGMRVETEIEIPEQNEKLPHIIEAIVVQAGQHFMKEYYRQAIEKADAELVLSKRSGKEGAGIQRIGTRPNTFKTDFGLRGEAAYVFVKILKGIISRYSAICILPRDAREVI